MPAGRLSSYTDEIANVICDQIAEGASMRKICEADDMPFRSTVLRWMAERPDFAAKCAHARLLQADVLFEEMQDVADEGNPEDVQRAKLRVSTMQWRASKLAPKKYGDRTVLAGDPDAPLETRVDLSGLNPEQLRALANVKLPADR